MRRINHAWEFLDLVGACQRFVAATGRIVPSLRERPFSEDERDTVHRNVAIGPWGRSPNQGLQCPTEEIPQSDIRWEALA